jgi:hypothetical protein
VETRRSALVVVRLLGLIACLVCVQQVSSQTKKRASREEAEFGPVVSAYLGYLRAQQEVVDDRVSRREVDRRYYAHNSNRIRALRLVAIKIARGSDLDYLPELEAVSLDEFVQLFDDPLPDPTALQVGETLDFKFRYLETVTVQREKFYVFARLDPYEQAELRKQSREKAKTGVSAEVPKNPVTDAATRPRKLNSP